MSNIIKILFTVVLASTIVMPISAKSIISVSYNGEKMQLDQHPQIRDDSVLLPLRSLSQSLGYYRVNWNAAAKQIDITERGINIQLVIGADKAKVNGLDVKLNVPAQIIEGITYVPLRFVGEALNMGVGWDSQTQSVNLESKYSLDEPSKQLQVRSKEGKKAIVKVNTLYEDADTTYVDHYVTKNGSELVSVHQTMQGAAGSGSSNTTFYIKDGIIIDKVEKTFNYLSDNGVIELEDSMVLNHGDNLKIYDDKIGSLIKSYDFNDFQEGLNLDIIKINAHYIMGRHKETIHVIDLQTGKVARILDLIPEVDQDYVFQSDMHLSTDNIELVSETDTELIFEYYSITEETEKTVTYKLGK